MEPVYTDLARMLRALSDPKRLKITDMLSCGEICACRILDYFHITQPTLSHDMKVLAEAGIVKSRREGKNTYYALDDENLARLLKLLGQTFQQKDQCICEDGDSCCEPEPEDPERKAFENAR